MRTLFNLRCNECNHEGLLYDESRGELFCQNCGLIIDDKYSIMSVPDILERLRLEEMNDRKELMKSLK